MIVIAITHPTRSKTVACSAVPHAEVEASLGDARGSRMDCTSYVVQSPRHRASARFLLNQGGRSDGLVHALAHVCIALHSRSDCPERIGCKAQRSRAGVRRAHARR